MTRRHLWLQAFLPKFCKSGPVRLPLLTRVRDKQRMETCLPLSQASEAKAASPWNALAVAAFAPAESEELKTWLQEKSCFGVKAQEQEDLDEKACSKHVRQGQAETPQPKAKANQKPAAKATKKQSKKSTLKRRKTSTAYHQAVNAAEKLGMDADAAKEMGRQAAKKMAADINWRQKTSDLHPVSC